MPCPPPPAVNAFAFNFREPSLRSHFTSLASAARLASLFLLSVLPLASTSPHTPMQTTVNVESTRIPHSGGQPQSAPKAASRAVPQLHGSQLGHLRTRLPALTPALDNRIAQCRAAHRSINEHKRVDCCCRRWSAYRVSHHTWRVSSLGDVQTQDRESRRVAQPEPTKRAVIVAAMRAGLVALCVSHQVAQRSKEA